ncbi:MAG: transglycosylase SLT domain-containing protein, partial [Methylococcales bacterium]|nr:transglycosylase SLT domain-containing protein [Methylococcales bacterium]
KVDKRMEAKRQWWYAVTKLDKKDILIAAKYAQQLDWTQTAIFTIAKAKYWDDVSLRFPLAYQDQVQKNADKQQLNPAVIFGLIRRESAFNQDAQSPVGARGLMQIMPKTGRQIAKELKEKWRNKNNLFNPSTNVKYGAYYYKQLLNQFNGHYALAAAAYNAGPHRVKRWLPVENALAADIWVETIPFKETRAYVSAVLTYALIYQKQLKKNILTMKDFMRDVLPG